MFGRVGAIVSPYVARCWQVLTCAIIIEVFSIAFFQQLGSPHWGHMAPNGCLCGCRHSLRIFDTPASRDSWSALARLSKKSFFFWVFTIKYISRYFTRGWTHGQAAAGASHKLRAGRLMDQFCPWTDELINIYFFHTLQYWLNSLFCNNIAKVTPHVPCTFRPFFF